MDSSESTKGVKMTAYRCIAILILFALTPLMAEALPTDAQTPHEAYKAFNRNINGEIPAPGIRYVAGKEPFAIVTLSRGTMGQLFKAQTPYGYVQARMYDRHFTGPKGGATPMAGEGIVVNAPKALPVVLHAPFTPTALTINGKSVYDDQWKPKIQSEWSNYSVPPKGTIYVYGTIILPGGRSVLEYVVE